MYQRAFRFREEADELIAALRPGRTYVAQQLQRAALSIGANIAEGAGEFSPKEKARFYRMARRSAIECASLLETFPRYSRASVADIDRARGELKQIVSLLIRLIRNIEGRP